MHRMTLINILTKGSYRAGSQGFSSPSKVKLFFKISLQHFLKFCLNIAIHFDKTKMTLIVKDLPVNRETVTA